MTLLLPVLCLITLLAFGLMLMIIRFGLRRAIRYIADEELGPERDGGTAPEPGAWDPGTPASLPAPGYIEIWPACPKCGARLPGPEPIRFDLCPDCEARAATGWSEPNLSSDLSIHQSTNP